MKKLSNKGFTLVELIIVIAILAIIMLIALPNVPQIIQRQRVKADIASAQKIAEYVRAWYTDYSIDPLLESKVTTFEAAKATITAADGSNPATVTVTPIKYDTLDGIDTYIAKKYEPKSLLDADGVAVDDQCFAVFLAGTSSTSKIAVAILSAEELDAGDYIVETVDEVDVIKAAYDGYKYDADKHKNSSSVAYIEE